LVCRSTWYINDHRDKYSSLIFNFNNGITSFLAKHFCDGVCKINGSHIAISNKRTRNVNRYV